MKKIIFGCLIYDFSVQWHPLRYPFNYIIVSLNKNQNEDMLNLLNDEAIIKIKQMILEELDVEIDNLKETY